MTTTRKRPTRRIRTKKEGWLKRFWRPLMAWQYFFVCSYDFLFAPIFYNHLSYTNPEKVIQWAPITLQGGGVYHIAMGAIIGIYTWARGMEKINMIQQNIIPTSDGETITQLPEEKVL